MVEKPNVLFLFFEGLADTVIDSQVIAHVRELGEAGIARFTVLCAACSETEVARSRERRADAEQRAHAPIHIVAGQRARRPASVRENARRIRAHLGEQLEQFTHIHARTEYSALVAHRLAQSTGAVVIWDCRGDAAAEVDYRRDLAGSVVGRLWRTMFRYGLQRRTWRAAALCDRALFVSKPLRALVEPALAGKQTQVVPSCASPAMFYFDPRLREETRKRLGYAPEDQVLTYVGGMQVYQRFPESIAAFKELAQREPNSKLLVVSPADEARSILEGQLPWDRWIALKGQHREINAYLNASDAAFMLREDTPTNHAASPTKFAEYCLSGLPVIMTRAVPDSFEFAQSLGTLVRFDEATGEIGSLPVVDRALVARKAVAILGKGVYLESYRAIYAPRDSGER